MCKYKGRIVEIIVKLYFCVPARVAINIKKLIFSARDDLVKVS